MIARRSRNAQRRCRARSRAGLGILVVLLISLACAPACSQLPVQDLGEISPQSLLVEKLGGETTAFTHTGNAFSLSARNLNNLEHRTFQIGDSFFNQNWVTAPASSEARDGLGPTFNAQSCSSCHTHDGRGRPPENAEDPQRGLLLRLSVPGEASQGEPPADPKYGGQLQDRAILSVRPEGRIGITYTEIVGNYGDGEPFVLRAPRYTIDDLQFGDLAPRLMVSPRIAPAVFGVGLLEAIPESDIVAGADPEDGNGDGISGRVNRVWNVRQGRLALGRFGWKANQPTVEQQVAGAFLGDLGITSSLFPGENCPAPQRDCQDAPNGGSPELTEDRLQKVTFYNRTLAVPAMRGVEDPQILKGAGLFLSSGCAQCHTPKHVTGETDIPALSHQTIFPYTDLLLHDMGEPLADHRPDFQADGREWRTPPLWGIGLIETVNGHTRLLHDGRARNLAEAILWHGGEGESARESFRNLSGEDRAAVIRFLQSL